MYNMSLSATALLSLLSNGSVTHNLYREEGRGCYASSVYKSDLLLVIAVAFGELKDYVI